MRASTVSAPGSPKSSASRAKERARERRELESDRGK